MTAGGALAGAIMRVGHDRSLYRLGHVALLAAAPWALLRAATSRRFVRAFPRFAAKARLVVAGYAVAVAALAIWAPTLLFPLALLAALASAGLAWRARVGYGCPRGLPPGSLAVLPLAPWFDPWFYREAAARHGPVFKSSFLVRPLACVVGLARGLELLREHHHGLEPTPLAFSRFIPRGFLRHMEPSAHETYRAIFRAAFSRALVDEREPALASCVRAGLRRLGDGPDGGTAPLGHLHDLVFRGWVGLFFGIPPEGDVVARLRTLYDVLDIRNPTRAADADVLAALDEVETAIRGQIRCWTERGGHGERPPRCVAAELLHAQPDALDDPTVIRNLIYLLHTSSNDVTGLLHWILKILSDHPVWVARLRRDLADIDPDAARRPDSLASRIVSESLRLEQSEYLYRSVIRDVSFAGFVIPKGWMVRICVRESHRDPAVFDEPDTFDPDRFLRRGYTREQYAPFGLHRFTCLGEHLARTVARVFACELVQGYDWTVVADGPPEFGSWQHWTPSPAFRITLRPRA